MSDGQYRIKLLDVHRTHMAPFLISTVWSISGGYRGEWFLVYPTPVSKLFPGRVDAGPGFTLDMTLDELERQGMSKAFTVEHAYFKDRGLESEFQVPKGTDVQLKDIAPHWLSGFVTNELNDVVQETNCPALKRDLVALRGIPPVK